jgi:hypothetical protein
MEYALKILGKKYALRFVEKVNDKEDLMGLCNDAQQDIQVSLHQPKDALKDTILHEIIHAVDYQMQLGLKERQVHGMAAGLVAVFLDNPEFIEQWNNLNTES